MAHPRLRLERSDSTIQLSLRNHLEVGDHAKKGKDAAHSQLHRRRERVHLWSKPCRRLPLAKRAQCERGVDAAVLKDKTWIPLKHSGKASAFTLTLDHD